MVCIMIRRVHSQQLNHAIGYFLAKDMQPYIVVYRDIIVYRDKLSINYHDMKFSLSPKPTHV